MAGQKLGTALRRGLDEVNSALFSEGPGGQAWRDHAGPAKALLNFAQSGGLAGGDATGSMSVGPSGINLNKRGADGRPEWALSVSPAASSAGLRVGDDFSVGASWAKGNPSGFLSKGPVKVEGGYGRPPGFDGSATPGGWGQVSFSAGGSGPVDVESQVGGVAGAVDQAVSPYVRQERLAEPVSARDEMERLLQERRSSDPYWYRP